MSVHQVWVVDVATKNPVEAELDDDLSVESLLDIEADWEPFRKGLRRQLRQFRVPRNQWPQSLHWNWADKSLPLTLGKSSADQRIFGLRGKGDWQAVMVTRKNQMTALLAPGAGRELIYIDFLESAPWNWSIAELRQERRFGKIGKLMVRAAVEQSVAEGSDGRISLHSLPQAEGFYQSCGMTRMKLDAAYDNLPYYELTAQAAQAFLLG
jgi:hypothetical protein